MYSQPPIRPLKGFDIQRPDRTILPNGIPLSIIDAAEQEVLRIDIVFEGGTWDQSQKLQATFTNRMLREGTTRYTTGQIAELLDYHGAYMELTCAPHHSFLTVYLPSRHLANILPVVTSMVAEPIFPQKELATVTESNLQQFRLNLGKVGYLAKRELLRHLYGAEHPCGQPAEEEDYAHIDRQALHDFHSTFYQPGNCSIFLSGRVTGEIARMAEECFSQPAETPQAARQQRIPPPPAPGKEKRVFINQEHALQSAVKMGCHTVRQQHPDFQKLRILVTLLGGYFGSRLMANIREEKGYTYGISANVATYPDSSLLTISAETDNRHVQPLIDEVYREIERLQQDVPPAEELATVKNYMLGEICRNFESPLSLADAWIFIATNRLDDGYFAQAIQAINEITPQDIRYMAQKYLDKEMLKEIVAGKKLS